MKNTSKKNKLIPGSESLGILTAAKKITPQKYILLKYTPGSRVVKNTRLGLEWAVNGLGKPFRNKSDPKNRKNSKNQSEIAACEQKTTTEKPNFCSNTIFALYFKIRAKKNHAARPLAFSLHFLFRRDQNHYSDLTSKIMKMCEQISKKDSAPIQFKFFEL